MDPTGGSNGPSGHGGGVDDVGVQSVGVVGVVVALCLVIATVVVLYVLRTWGGRSRRRNVLLCGISNAGKTLLFSQLCAGKPTQTYVSIKENQGSYQLADGRTLRLVDIPGNERQRVNLFASYKATARAIVFVVDSVAFMKDLKDVAEYVYTVLSDPDTCAGRLRVLFACNKQDDGMAKSGQLIRTSLEKELNVLRKTQTSKLVTTEGTQLGRTLGRQHKDDFEFGDLPHRIDFVEFSATDNLAPVTDWLATV